MQLKRIEEHYGAKPFKRGPRQIELTEAGRVLYQKAKHIVELEEEARGDICNSLHGSSGVLSIALPSASSAKLLSFMLRIFMEEWPDVQLSVHEPDSQGAADYVAAGLAEIGFIKTPITEAYAFNFSQCHQRLWRQSFPRSRAIRFPM